MDEEGCVIWAIVLVVLLLGILYGVWQFRLCMRNVCEGSACWWYCFQHAFGG